MSGPRVEGAHFCDVPEPSEQSVEAWWVWHCDVCGQWWQLYKLGATEEDRRKRVPHVYVWLVYFSQWRHWRRAQRVRRKPDERLLCPVCRKPGQLKHAKRRDVNDSEVVIRDCFRFACPYDHESTDWKDSPETAYKRWLDLLDLVHQRIKEETENE